MKAADKLIAIALAAGSLLFLGWLALRFFLPATLPFWLGLAIAALLRPVSLLFSQKLHLRRRRAAAFVMTLFYLLLGLLVWLALLLLWSWLSSLTVRAPQLYRTIFLMAQPFFVPLFSRPCPDRRPVAAELFRSRCPAVRFPFFFIAEVLYLPCRLYASFFLWCGGHHPLLQLYLAGLPACDPVSGPLASAFAALACL